MRQFNGAAVVAVSSMYAAIFHATTSVVTNGNAKRCAFDIEAAINGL